MLVLYAFSFRTYARAQKDSGPCSIIFFIYKRRAKMPLSNTLDTWTIPTLNIVTETVLSLLCVWVYGCGNRGGRGGWDGVDENDATGPKLPSISV